MGFSAYGVTQGDDPLSQAMKGLIDNASGHEHQIALLWQAIEKLSGGARELPRPTGAAGRAHDRELRRRAAEPEQGQLMEKLPRQHQLLGWHLGPEVLDFLAATGAELDVDEYG